MTFDSFRFVDRPPLRCPVGVVAERRSRFDRA